MKVLIRVTRRTEYASIVEMPQAEYDKLKIATESGWTAIRRKAEKKLNALIDEKDWQDDEFTNLEEFEPFDEPSTSPPNSSSTDSNLHFQQNNPVKPIQ